MSKAEEELALHLKAEKIDFEREYRFHDTRRFRFDFALLEHKIAVEVDGGMWMKGGHTSGVGASRDREKDELALRDGWTVYRCTPEMVKKGSAIDTIKILIKLKE